MKAIILTEQGPALRETPIPVPRAAEVLVRVRAASLNRADLGMAAGQAHGRSGGAGTVLGLEWSGEVEAVGDGITDLRPGDRVMCSGIGAFAEYAVAHRCRVSKLPNANLDFRTAATFPVALQTMHDAIVTNGQFRPGQSVLIQGATTGMGLMGLQIARELGAGLVIGSSANAERRARLAEFGADLAIDTGDPGWPDAVLAATGGRGVDVIVDMVAGTLVNGNLRAARVLGRVVNVGRVGGEEAMIDLNLHSLRRISYVGVTFRTRSSEEVAEINRLMRRDLWPALEAGRLRLPIATEFPLAQANEALAAMRANRHFGKILLLP